MLPVGATAVVVHVRRDEMPRHGFDRVDQIAVHVRVAEVEADADIDAVEILFDEMDEPMTPDLKGGAFLNHLTVLPAGTPSGSRSAATPRRLLGAASRLLSPGAGRGQRYRGALYHEHAPPESGRDTTHHRPFPTACVFPRSRSTSRFGHHPRALSASRRLTVKTPRTPKRESRAVVHSFCVRQPPPVVDPGGIAAAVVIVVSASCVITALRTGSNLQKARDTSSDDRANPAARRGEVCSII